MRRKARLAEILPALLKLQRRGNYNVDDDKDTKKKMWDKPIVKAGAGIAALIGLNKGSKALGRRLGATTYTKKRGELGRKFNS